MVPCELRLREHSWDRTGFRACRLRMNAFFPKHPGSAQSIPAPPSGCGSSIENLVSSLGLWLLPEVIRHLPCIVVLPQSILSCPPTTHPKASRINPRTPRLLPQDHTGSSLGSSSTPGPLSLLPQDYPGSSPALAPSRTTQAPPPGSASSSRFWLHPRTTQTPPPGSGSTLRSPELFPQVLALPQNHQGSSPRGSQARTSPNVVQMCRTLIKMWEGPALSLPP